jgi:hypothetical protein
MVRSDDGLRLWIASHKDNITSCSSAVSKIIANSQFIKLSGNDNDNENFLCYECEHLCSGVTPALSFESRLSDAPVAVSRKREIAADRFNSAAMCKTFAPWSSCMYARCEWDK